MIEKTVGPSVNKHDNNVIPVLKGEYKKLSKLLEALQESHRTGLEYWNVILTDIQNSLLVGEIENVRLHLNWMYHTISRFRANIIEAERELNSLEQLPINPLDNMANPKQEESFMSPAIFTILKGTVTLIFWTMRSCFSLCNYAIRVYTKVMSKLRGCLSSKRRDWWDEIDVPF